MIAAWIAANIANIICVLLIAGLVLWLLRGKKGGENHCEGCGGKCSGSCGMCAVYKPINKKEEEANK